MHYSGFSLYIFSFTVILLLFIFRCLVFSTDVTLSTHKTDFLNLIGSIHNCCDANGGGIMKPAENFDKSSTGARRHTRGWRPWT